MKPCWTVDDLCVFGRFLCRFLLLAWRPDSPLEGPERQPDEPTDNQERLSIACVFFRFSEISGISLVFVLFSVHLRRRDATMCSGSIFCADVHHRRCED